MRIPAAALSLFALASGTAAESDPRAVAIAERVMDALGGRSAWDATRYLRFAFAFERDGQGGPPRQHWWDRWTGDYRVEMRARDGGEYRVMMNLNTKSGTAYDGDGNRLTGDAADTALVQAFGAWTNDTYWLLMPYKLRDAGVTLHYDGEASDGDVIWDKVQLSFEAVGLTPKDLYWIYVNRQTGLIDRWDFILNGGAGPPSSFRWSEWRRYGDIMLSADKPMLDGSARIHFPVLEIPAGMPSGWMTDAGSMAAR